MGNKVVIGLCALFLPIAVATIGLWIFSYWSAPVVTFTEQVGYQQRLSANKGMIRIQCDKNGKQTANAFVSVGMLPDTPENERPSSLVAYPTFRAWKNVNVAVFRNPPDNASATQFLQSSATITVDEMVYLSPQQRVAIVLQKQLSRRGIEYRMEINFPAWILAVLTLVPNVPFLLVKMRHRPISGRCAKCGYDLRATPNRCPECGTIPIKPAEIQKPAQAGESV